ncbi:hypothetical protein KCU68_g35, partial [Aureobasidium melanogenum]
MQLETVLLNREVCKLKNLVSAYGTLDQKKDPHIREYVSFSVGGNVLRALSSAFWLTHRESAYPHKRFPNHLLDIVSVFPSLKFTACPQSVAYVRSYIFVDDICLNSDNLTHQIGMTKNRSNIRFLTAGDKQMNFRGGKLCNASDPIEQILSGNDELIKSVEYETNLTISATLEALASFHPDNAADRRKKYSRIGLDGVRGSELISCSRSLMIEETSIVNTAGFAKTMHLNPSSSQSRIFSSCFS